MLLNMCIAIMLFVLGYMGGLTILAAFGLMGVLSTAISASVCIGSGLAAAASPKFISA